MRGKMCRNRWPQQGKTVGEAIGGYGSSEINAKKPHYINVMQGRWWLD
jgi:hypothetical protein